jgi:hypothetical protein
MAVEGKRTETRAEMAFSAPMIEEFLPRMRCRSVIADLPLVRDGNARRALDRPLES